jgi:hypothetical protein
MTGQMQASCRLKRLFLGCYGAGTVPAEFHVINLLQNKFTFIPSTMLAFE